MTTTKPREGAGIDEGEADDASSERIDSVSRTDALRRGLDIPDAVTEATSTQGKGAPSKGHDDEPERDLAP